MEDSPRRKKWVRSEDTGREIRSWAPSELLFRETGLLELAQLFEELEVPYFVADGTLLGAARDGDFIPWDSDVGIWIKAEVYRTDKDRLLTQLASRGFTVDEIGGRNSKLNAHKYSEKFELESWRLVGRYRVRGGYKIPAHLLDNPGQIELRGRYYPCPSPVEDFLFHRYGEDWRVPKVLSESSVFSKTRWALMKIKLRRFSPKWLIHSLSKS